MTISTTSLLNSSVGPTALQTRTRFPDIAFIGKAGSGKTTAAQHLCDTLGYMRASFAGKLKEVAAEIWGPDVYNDRDKLQKLGVAVREIDHEAWVNVLMRKIDCSIPANWPVVIDDCRFGNEYWALKERGFKIVRVDADRDQRLVRLQANGRLSDESQLDHESETAIDDFTADYSIVNDQTKLGLAYKVDDMLRVFGMELS